LGQGGKTQKQKIVKTKGSSIGVTTLEKRPQGIEKRAVHLWETKDVHPLRKRTKEKREVLNN